LPCNPLVKPRTPFPLLVTTVRETFAGQSDGFFKWENSKRYRLFDSFLPFWSRTFPTLMRYPSAGIKAFSDFQPSKGIAGELIGHPLTIRCPKSDFQPRPRGHKNGAPFPDDTHDSDKAVQTPIALLRKPQSNHPRHTLSGAKRKSLFGLLPLEKRQRLEAL
jgi:hypothetical protein